MPGPFKLQGKKNHCAPAQYLTKPARMATRGRQERKDTPGQVGWVPGRAGEKKNRAPRWEGTDCPNGRGAKGTSEEGLGGIIGNAFSTRAQC